jgi:tripartite-type tricarboxylate transporter receptor subunit TctC
LPAPTRLSNETPRIHHVARRRGGTPVAGIFRVPQVMEVNPSVPVKTVPEFIAYAKANRGKVNMASAGIGSVHHVVANYSNS